MKLELGSWKVEGGSQKSEYRNRSEKLDYRNRSEKLQEKDEKLTVRKKKLEVKG